MQPWNLLHALAVHAGHAKIKNEPRKVNVGTNDPPTMTGIEPATSRLLIGILFLN